MAWVGKNGAIGSTWLNNDGGKGLGNRISKFRRCDLDYSYTGKGYVHNFDRDIHLIIIWEKGRRCEETIIDELDKRFNLLYCANVCWSGAHKRTNFGRLYPRMRADVALTKYKHVGMGDFICIIFEDINPEYNYVRSLGGDIFVGNVNVVSIKSGFRELLGDNLVHGTSSIDEFFHQASLILHEDKLNRIINLKNWDKKRHQLNRDMVGANGWSSFNEMFRISNYCCTWAILRNHEHLPHDFWDNENDLDILCADPTLFLSAINGVKRKGGMSAYEINIEDRIVPVDVQFIGDYYYDPVWEIEMLSRGTYKNEIIPILRDDDYFFSLLYHAKLRKPEVKEVYIDRLISLGKRLGITDINRAFILDNERSGRLINGFLKSNCYRFYPPTAGGGYLNENVRQFVTERPILATPTLRHEVVRNIARVTPKFATRLVPRMLKNWLLR